LKGKTHFSFAIFFLLIVSLFADLNLIFFISSVFLLFGTMFADIDEVNSFLGKKIKIIGYIFDHRGFFHSIFSLMLFFVFMILFFGYYYALFFAIGYLLHLLLDSFTKEGIKPFIFGLRISGDIKVGSIIENIIYLFLIFSNILLFSLILFLRF
jgi:inner membrane protein